MVLDRSRSLERFLPHAGTSLFGLTKKDVLHFTLLALFVQWGLIGTYNVLYKIAKRNWLINESILHFSPRGHSWTLRP